MAVMAGRGFSTTGVALTGGGAGTTGGGAFTGGDVTTLVVCDGVPWVAGAACGNADVTTRAVSVDRAGTESAAARRVWGTFASRGAGAAGTDEASREPSRVAGGVAGGVGCGAGGAACIVAVSRTGAVGGGVGTVAIGDVPVWLRSRTANMTTAAAIASPAASPAARTPHRRPEDDC